MGSILLQPLLVQIKLHAEREVRVLNDAIGDEEWHGGEGGQAVHLTDEDEDQSDAGDHQKGIHGNAVGTTLKKYLMHCKMVKVRLSRNVQNTQI